ncbi:MAG: N-formylglutamate amidohydrolase [Rhodobacteraceae bacterium]|nr:N-formylglutamate amidohydrolase [Paracoccaceae bacterium]
MPRAVEVREPARTTSPVVFASPHSGRVYPADLMARSQVSERVLRSSEDAFVDLLLSGAPDFGACLVTTEVPRAYVDFNRAADELDPALIEGVPRAGLNPRVASGLGVLARVVSNGRAIYRGKLPRAEAERRIARYWTPYHAALDGVLARQHARFGAVLLCDVHSMPHEALAGHPGRGPSRPDVILGDRWGASASASVMGAVETVLREHGFVVARNSPFAGAYVAQRHGQPSRGRHAIQIEIDRALYLDEATIEPLPRFDAFRDLMSSVVKDLAAIDPGQGLADGRAGLAAE